MPARLDGKVAFLVGWTDEVGCATARLMLERGAKVAGVDIPGRRGGPPEAASVAKDRFLALAGDVAKEDEVCASIGACVARFGRLDILITNVCAPVDSSEAPLEAFDRVMETSVVGVFLAMKHGIAAMTAGGSIVNILGVSGDGAACPIAEEAGRAAVIGMTATAALECGEKGIRVNCIEPAMLGARSDPRGVAALACFLASDAAGFVTGSVHRLDGGRTP
ncbi:MAG: SDR family NAD(P)-dependent oxidoreductase [Caulobacteraceae bacterium]